MTTATGAKTMVYEAMFVAGQAAAANFTGLLQEIEAILARGAARVLAMRKWDERRLAYPINKEKRAVYILVYFEAPTGGLKEIEHYSNISEVIMRHLIIKADHLTEEEIASNDDRQGLTIEAKMRASQMASGEERQRAGVSLGAPRRNKPEAEAAPSEDMPGDDADAADSDDE